jgi:hypothetical protein
MNIISTSQNQQQAVSGGFRVDISRGERIGRVSSEWFSRPDDERYLSLTELYDAVKARADRATARTVESRAVRVEASREDAERLALDRARTGAARRPDALELRTVVQPCRRTGILYAPASRAAGRHQPAARLAIAPRRACEDAWKRTMAALSLRAVTGPDYGRIWDHELVAAVMRIAGNGTGDTMWKVPGVLDWATMTHNPFVDITKDTTTLYASDRDVFCSLVDDTHPIEAGRLPNGEPDLYFRGFYCWNSEVGSKTLGIASHSICARCA